jgi:hypothetical protein
MIRSGSTACPEGYSADVNLVFKLEDSNGSPLVATEQIEIVIEADAGYMDTTQLPGGVSNRYLYIEIGESETFWREYGNMLDNGQGECGYESDTYVRLISITPTKYDCNSFT